MPAGGQKHETEWEEVIISEAHVPSNSELAEDKGSVGVMLGQPSQRPGDSNSEQAEKDNAGLGMPPSSEVLSPNASAKKTVG